MTKAPAQRAYKKTQRTLRAFLDALPDRPMTPSEEAKRQRLIQAQDRALEACWTAEDTPPVPRKASDLRKELREELDLLKQDAEPQVAVPVNRRRSAIHEAAHAVGFEVRGVRVLSVTLHECRPEKPEAVGALCGAIAGQRIGFDDAHSPADIAMAKAVLLSEGKSEQWLPGVESEAQSVVAASWWLIRGVAAALYERGNLTGDEVRRLMGRSAWELQEEARYNLQHAHNQRMALVSAW